MKVALTGATGFVGRHVREALERKPTVELTLVSRRPRPPELDGGTGWATLDIAEAPEDSFVRIGQPDVLIHLAWDGLPNYKLATHFEEEAPRQYRFLKRLAEQGLKRLAVTGTCFEYGMVEGRLSEVLPPAPSNAYGVAKDQLRRELELTLPALGCDLVWARLFYMFGEGQNASSLYQLVMRACAERAERFAMSGGEQLRDFLPVETVADHVVALALAPDVSGIVNIGSGRPRSVRAMVESWVNAARHEMKLDLGHYPYPDYEPFAFWAATERLDKLRGGRS